MNYKLINLTPHAIHVLMRDEKNFIIGCKAFVLIR